VQQQKELVAQEEELGQLAMGDGHRPKTGKPPKIYHPRNPRLTGMTNTVFDYAVYAASWTPDKDNPDRLV
jgi:hypothetical protein